MDGGDLVTPTMAPIAVIASTATDTPMKTSCGRPKRGTSEAASGNVATSAYHSRRSVCRGSRGGRAIGAGREPQRRRRARRIGRWRRPQLQVEPLGERAQRIELSAAAVRGRRFGLCRLVAARARQRSQQVERFVRLGGARFVRSRIFHHRGRIEADFRCYRAGRYGGKRREVAESSVESKETLAGRTQRFHSDGTGTGYAADR